MTDIIINEKYTEEEKELIRIRMIGKALVGADDAPETQEAFDVWCEKVVEEKRTEIAKAEQKKLNRIKNEIERANTLGLTVEEYKEYKKYEANVKRNLTMVQKCEAELAVYKKKMEYWEKKKTAMLKK